MTDINSDTSIAEEAKDCITNERETEIFFDLKLGEYVFIDGDIIFSHPRSKAKQIENEKFLDGVPKCYSTYNPSRYNRESNIYTDDRGRDFYNKFVPSQYIKQYSDEAGSIPKSIQILLDHTFDDDRLKEVFINALAHHVQVGKAIHLGWVFVGVQGSGKGTLVELITKLFGRHNTQKVSLNELASDKMKGVPEKLLAHCDERVNAKTADRVMENFKKIIGNSSYGSRALHQNEIDVKNWSMFILTVNEFDIQMSINDRRMNIVSTNETLESVVGDTGAYRAELFNHHTIQEFVNYLLSYTVDQSMVREIVNTEARQEAIESVLPVQELIAKAIADCSFQNISEMVDFDKDEESGKGTISKINEMFNVLRTTSRLSSSGARELAKNVLSVLYNESRPDSVMSIMKELKKHWIYSRALKINGDATTGFVVSENGNERNTLALTFQEKQAIKKQQQI